MFSVHGQVNYVSEEIPLYCTDGLTRFTSYHGLPGWFCDHEFILTCNRLKRKKSKDLFLGGNTKFVHTLILRLQGDRITELSDFTCSLMTSYSFEYGEVCGIELFVTAVRH
jgi:hypothetical protein